MTFVLFCCVVSVELLKISNISGPMRIILKHVLPCEVHSSYCRPEKKHHLGELRKTKTQTKHLYLAQLFLPSQDTCQGILTSLVPCRVIDLVLDSSWSQKLLSLGYIQLDTSENSGDTAIFRLSRNCCTAYTCLGKQHRKPLQEVHQNIRLTRSVRKQAYQICKADATQMKVLS